MHRRSMYQGQARFQTSSTVDAKFILVLALSGIAGLALAFSAYQDGFDHGQSTCPEASPRP
jgi:hypothetical protein